MSIIEEPTLYTSEDLVHGISNFINSLSEKMDFIPQDLQLPFVIALGLLGFLAVLGLSKLSARNAKVQFDSDGTAAPSTPQKTPIANRSSSGTPLEEKTGTVMTPAGRRSARIARTRRKEE